MDFRISVRGNVIASFLGKFWASLLNLAFIPLYIKLLGVEVYGLVGVYMSLVAFLSLLDMGISATLSRELPRLYGEAGGEEARDLVCTFERVYWLVGLAMFCFVAVFAPLISIYWIKSSVLHAHEIERVIIVMGVTIALQWPSGMYASGLMGLQRHGHLNVLRSVMILLQHGGSVCLLMLVSPSIFVFFCWQAAVGLLTTIVLGVGLWRVLPGGCRRARFSRELLGRHWRFATGMTGISLTSILLTQADKIILSKVLTLEAFSYYILAFNIANVMVTLVNPIFVSLFPRLSQLVALNDQKSVSDLYHKGCQLAALVVLPVAMTLMFFSRQILDLWIGNDVVVENVFFLLILLVIGAAINALMTLPFALMLAYGWTRLVFVQNVLSILLLIPALYWLSVRYGAEGAAFVWIVLNMGYLFFQIPIMHRRLLRDEMCSWYWYDFVQPVVVAASIAVCFSFFEPTGVRSFASVAWVFVAGVCSFAMLALLMATTRKNLLLYFSNKSIL